MAIIPPQWKDAHEEWLDIQADPLRRLALRDKNATNECECVLARILEPGPQMPIYACPQHRYWSIDAIAEMFGF